jgi:hypothetical protein
MIFSSDRGFVLSPEDRAQIELAAERLDGDSLRALLYAAVDREVEDLAFDLIGALRGLTPAEIDVQLEADLELFLTHANERQQ